jgi:hypothetical protein
MLCPLEAWLRSNKASDQPQQLFDIFSKFDLGSSADILTHFGRRFVAIRFITPQPPAPSSTATRKIA